MRAVVLWIALLTSCAQPKPVALSADDLARIGMPPLEDCGFSAVRSKLLTEGINKRPKACALPTTEEVAQSCAIHDQVSAPDYDGRTDEMGELINWTPPPEYRVTSMSCFWENEEHNSAACRFGLALPGEAEGARIVEAKFQHIHWRHDGPTSHWEGTRWSLEADCTQGATSKQ